MVIIGSRAVIGAANHLDSPHGWQEIKCRLVRIEQRQAAQPALPTGSLIVGWQSLAACNAR